MTAPHLPPESDSSARERRTLRSLLFVRRRDQRTMAAVLAMALAAMTIWVWSQSEQVVDIETSPPTRLLRFKVDPNRADVAELALLPEVGEKLARRIVAERERNGPFRAPKDLLRVHGIGEGKLARMRPYLVFPPAQTAGP